MTDFKLGQVFEGEIAGKSATAVVVRSFGALAEAAVAPDREQIITLHQDHIADWQPVPATERDWYLEGVWSDNHLLWSVFIPGFEAAWAFFTYRLPDLAADGGSIRVEAADEASEDEVMAFGSAYCGPQTIGFEAAKAHLRSAEAL